MDLYYRPEIPETTGYSNFKRRIRKTTYQGGNLKFDRPSLAMTEFAVDYLRELAPRELGKIDMYWASSMCQESFVSPCTLMVALMYARRLKVKNSRYLDTVPSSNLLLVSMMVASKFLVEVDETTLEEWMKASCMESDDLYQLEMEFLNALDWNLFVDNNDFWYFLLQLEQRIAWRQYLKRDEKFFTYTELQLLSQSKDGAMWNSFVKMCLDILKVLIACTTTYVVAVFTLASIPLLPRPSLVNTPGNPLNTFETPGQSVAKSVLLITDMTSPKFHSKVDRRPEMDGFGFVSIENSLETKMDDCCSSCDKMCPGMELNSSSLTRKNLSGIYDQSYPINNFYSLPDRAHPGADS